MANTLKNDVSRVVFFQDLNEQQLDWLVKITRVKHFEKGEMIFHEGDRADGFYAVVSGKVKIFKSSLSGREQTLHIFGPGAPFGEVAVFIGKSFPAHAQTLEKSTCLFFPENDFLNLIKKEPELVLNILAVLSRRLHMFTAQIESLSLKEVPERLAGYILLRSEAEAGDKIRLDIPKGELATLLGTIPETLSRILARMNQQGIIEVHGMDIHILDENRLDALANGLERL